MNCNANANFSVPNKPSSCINYIAKRVGFWASEVMPKLRCNVIFMEVKSDYHSGSVIFAIIKMSNYHSLIAILGSQS